MSDNLSNWLNAEIKKRHWSLRFVGRQGGISHATVARIANGELRGTEKTCLALARAFDVPLEDLLRLADLEQPNAARIRAPRIVYQADAGDRILALWRSLSPDDQALVLAMLERLAALEPRIIGDDQ